jgi:transposase
MSDHHFWLTEAQFLRLQPLLPNKPRGVPRVDDRRVISGIIHVIRNGLMWRDVPATYGPHKTLYNRFIRWGRIGVFDRIFATLAAEGTAPETVMIPSRRLLRNSLPGNGRRPTSKRTAPRRACVKRGCSPPYRADQRGPDLQAARGLRRRRQAIDSAAHRGPPSRRCTHRLPASGSAIIAAARPFCPRCRVPKP